MRRFLRPAPMERVGNEPATARSPLRMRLVLASFGLVVLLFATVLFALRGPLVAAVLAGAAALVTLVDLVIVVNRLRDARRPLR